GAMGHARFPLEPSEWTVERFETASNEIESHARLRRRRRRPPGSIVTHLDDQALVCTRDGNANHTTVPGGTHTVAHCIFDDRLQDERGHRYIPRRSIDVPGNAETVGQPKQLEVDVLFGAEQLLAQR